MSQLQSPRIVTYENVLLCHQVKENKPFIGTNHPTYPLNWFCEKPYFANLVENMYTYHYCAPKLTLLEMTAQYYPEQLEEWLRSKHVEPTQFNDKQLQELWTTDAYSDIWHSAIMHVNGIDGIVVVGLDNINAEEYILGDQNHNILRYVSQGYGE
jgi:hypothetical protein